MANNLSPKGNAKRGEILRVALEVFGSDGFGQASLREIARRCRTSTAGVLYYFGSKEDLFVEVLRSKDLFPPGGEPGPEGPDTTASPPEDYASFVAGIRSERSTPGLVSLFIAMASEARTEGHPAADFFRQRYQRLRTSISNSMSALGIRTRGGLDQDEAAILALAIIDGLQMQWLADQTFDIDGAVERGMAMVYEVEVDERRSFATPTAE